ncbi:MAG: hypothetical protein V6D39_15285 [Dolichospermum lemmermannii FEM_B0920]|nr:hypothetical protein [Anabaena sp. AL09]
MNKLINTNVRTGFLLGLLLSYNEEYDDSITTREINILIASEE